MKSRFMRGLSTSGAYLLLSAASLFALPAPDLADHAGGVLVHVGCGNGSLLRRFGTNEAFYAVGLDTNTANVAVLRETLREEEYGGRVLVDEWNGTDLPFIDHFVNALVLENPCSVSPAEVQRVLVPGGKAYRLQGTNWVAELKPRPAEMDEWTHWDYSAANNRCSRDRLVGPLRRMQWYAQPLWAKYHFSGPGVQTIVSSGGRMFYVVDESPVSTLGGGFPEKWTLVARDAFNGKLLWQRPMGAWGMAEYHYPSFFSAAVINSHYYRQQRRFVAAGDRLYGVLENNGPVVAMDAATGAIIRTFPGTETCQEIQYSNGRLYLRNSTNPKLAVFDAGTGDLVWSSTSGPSRISIHQNRLCLLGSTITALDATTFAQIWLSGGNSEAIAAGNGGLLIDAGPVIISRGASSWLVFSAADGQFLWKYPIAGHSRPVGLTAKPDQIFATADRVWTFKDDMNMVGLNFLTGAEEVLVPATNVFYASHHHRCHYDRATDRWFVSAQEGVELTSLTGETNQIHNWTRGTCNMGAVPANGLVYVPPAACACVYGAMLHGFYSYAAAGPETGRRFDVSERLLTGPAFGQVSGGAAGPDDWPQYRYSAQRKSATGCVVPKTLQQMWKINLGGELTPPVIAGGRLFAANRTDHAVFALDADTGDLLWQYLPGGEVDSPPSVWGDCVIFGCNDGRIYCLRAADGALVWRFQAAPRDCRNMQLEQVASVWPVPGSVLVDNGAVYCSAGHSSRLDGGIWIYKLDAVTGGLLATNRIEHVSPPVPAPTNTGSNDDEGLKNDLLVSDGTFLFLREAVFTSGLAGTTSSRNDHVMPQGNGFFDTSWHHRQAWTYNKIFAQYLCVDGQNVYGIKAYTRYAQWESFSMKYQPGSGYILFAQNVGNSKATEIADPGVQNALRPQPMKEHLWWQRIPLRVQAMVRAGDYLYAAGQPDVFDRDDPFAAFEGRAGGSLWTVSPSNGTRLAEYSLASPPVFDGLAAAQNRLYVSTMDGSVLCLGRPETAPAADASVQPASGTTETLFTFDATGSQDLDGNIVSYEWRVNGTPVSTNPVYTTTFGTVGARTIQLTVRDDDGMKGTDTEALSVTSPATDSDGDGLPDAWELDVAGNLSLGAETNNDGDGLTALQEYVYGTDPFLSDSDGDGLPDHLELIAGTSPVNADSLLRLRGQPLANGQMQLAWNSAPDRTYSIWGSSNITSGLNELVAYQLEAAPPVNTFTDPAERNPDGYFYKLQVTKTIPVPPHNAAPEARDDEAFAAMNTPVVISVLANDTDPDFHAISVSGVTPGSHGSVTRTSETVTYAPQAGWTGTDTFSYTVRDQPGATASGQVTVHVKAGVNRVTDPAMQQAHLSDSDIGYDQAGNGWCVGSKRAWWWDRDNEWSFVFCGKTEAAHTAMAQVIADAKATKGTQRIEFKAVHRGSGDLLQVRVYGVNGTSFNYDPSTTAVSGGTLLYDSGNVAGSEFDWMPFTGSVNFGSTGYDYHIILMWTDGIAPGSDEFIAVDNVYLGP